MSNKIVTRIPPSPTGNLHLGTARTALFNFLYAKKNLGKIILRFEDTDKKRSLDEFADNILTGLAWLGISYDEKYKQSERGVVYEKYLKKLIDNDKAYVSKEEDGERSEVIRFKNPKKIVKFQDEIRGEVSFDTTELGDFVIAKTLTEPLYHLAVVVDDFEMGVTHVIRGEDGISNTPRQILIQEAIGAPRPVYAHLPLILGKDKSKLSKRHGATSISDYKSQGYLPEAIINYLALLGWSPGDNREFFTLEELIEEFDFKNVQKGGAVFDVEKLDWFNKHYLDKMEDAEALALLKEYLAEFEIDADILQKIKPIVFERISKLSDIDQMVSDGELDYFKESPEYEASGLIWKKSDKDKTLGHLAKVRELLEKLEDFSEEGVKGAIWDYAEEEGKGDVLWPLRFALSGKDKSPDPINLSYILGKEKTLERIGYAIKKLS